MSSVVDPESSAGKQNMYHEAVFACHPNAVTSDDSGLALDATGNRVTLDITRVNKKVEELMAAAKAVNYKRLRAAAYPPAADYLDGIVKGDQAQIDKYIADCKAVKIRFPKPN